ncbi:MAG: hypothetical protein KHY39_00705 [Clostridiaceae bacterium]|nr:hypothetical protein [Clostridiaceae bacterium]
MNYNEFKAEFMKRLAEKAVQSDLIGTYQMFEDGMVSENPRYAKSLSFREIGDVIDQYEMVKDRLILRPLNYTDNKYVLKKLRTARWEIWRWCFILLLLIQKNLDLTQQRCRGRLWSSGEKQKKRFLKMP